MVLKRLFQLIIKFSKNKELNRKIKNYISNNEYINNSEYLKIVSYLPGPPPENSLLYKYPKVAKEWHYRLNYPLKPEMFFPMSAMKVFWICSKINTHVWKGVIYDRSRGHNCPYCAGRRASKENSFANKFPHLLEEFDYKKNIGIDPYLYTYASSKKAWWKCKYCKKSWRVSFASRSARGIAKPGCRSCSRKKITNHPET